MFERKGPMGPRRGERAARKPTKKRPQTRLNLEYLEDRCTPTITFQFDYTYDTSGFFNSSSARTVLEQAGQLLGSQLTDSLAAITPGSGNSWTATFNNPSGSSTLSVSNVSIAANTILVYVGAENNGGTKLGEGGPGGFSAQGSNDWYNLVKARGQTGALSTTATDFGPWGGSLTFDSGANWSFVGTAGSPGAGQYDFLSVALHELGHLLGVGTSASWTAKLSGTTFVGANSTAAYGSSVPVSSDKFHWADNILSNGTETAMDPTISAGVRKSFTTLDWAGLFDIGWNSGPTATTSTAGTTNALSQTVGDFDPNNGMWSLRGSPTSGSADGGQFSFGGTYWIRLVGDWDGNGTSDLGLFDPVSATWYLRTSGTTGVTMQVFQFGASGYLPVVGDWDGNGKTDIGVFNSNSGTWSLRNSASAGGSTSNFQFGSSGTSAVTGDWDGNGKTDIGVYDSKTGTWYLRNSTTAGTADTTFQFGGTGQIAVTGDWDGDGKTTIGVFDPVKATWQLRNSLSAGSADAGSFQYGLQGFLPVVGHWTVGSKDTVGLYDPNGGNWYLRTSTTSVVVGFGPAQWTAVVGDWDGNGTATPGLYDATSGYWYLRNSNSSGAPDLVFQFGGAGWKAVVGDWNGDKKTDVGVFNSDSATWYLRNSASAGTADAGIFQFGTAGTTPVTGDWDGNGKTDIGTYDAKTATWTLRNASSAGAASTTFQYGSIGWTPVVGDWNGDGNTTVGAVNPVDMTWYLKNSNSAGKEDYTAFTYGTAGQKVVVGDWNGPFAGGATATQPADMPSSQSVEVPIPKGCQCAACLSALASVSTGNISVQTDALASQAESFAVQTDALQSGLPQDSPTTQPGPSRTTKAQVSASLAPNGWQETNQTTQVINQAGNANIRGTTLVWSMDGDEVVEVSNEELARSTRSSQRGDKGEWPVGEADEGEPVDANFATWTDG